MSKLNLETNITNSPNLNCPECGGLELQARNEIEKFDFGLGADLVQLEAEVVVYECLKCNCEFSDSSSEDARHEAVCKHLGVFNPRKVKSVREKYELSRREMAAISKIGEASIARWESGALIQNDAYDNYLFLLMYKENFERICNRNKNNFTENRVIAGDKFKALIITPEILERESNFDLHRYLNAA